MAISYSFILLLLLTIGLYFIYVLYTKSNGNNEREVNHYEEAFPLSIYTIEDDGFNEDPYCGEFNYCDTEKNIFERIYYT